MGMAAPKEQFEAREVRGRSLHLSEPPLTDRESRCYEGLKQIASEGRRATQPELCAVVGCDYQTGTLPAIVNELVKKGYIERIGGRLQKGIWIRIVATGQETAQPPNITPHWRLRTESAPAPTIQALAERSKPLAQMIEAKARTLGKPLHEFLIDCVYAGFHAIDGDEE